MPVRRGRPAVARARKTYSRIQTARSGSKRQLDHELCRQIKDKDVKRIASRRLIGGIDQLRGDTDIISFSESTDVISYSLWRKR